MLADEHVTLPRRNARRCIRLTRSASHFREDRPAAVVPMDWQPWRVGDMKMKKWEWLLLTVGLLLILLGAVLARLHIYRRSQIDPLAIYQRIECGQTKDQAIALVGFPQGNYCTKSEVWYIHVHSIGPCPASHPTWQQATWQFDRGEVTAYLNEEGLVVARFCSPAIPDDHRLWDSLQRMLPFPK